ncbi:transaldolase family protein [Sphaerochaeta globosa]|uniref:Transaldolase n=1 Tax=Sphaerochaeta globosa (strain ATCC BAA-1886 / DSM 22777 / Buddy) TaxID=158189 RepID=F0RUI8_SPHGB|nr:transaldolase family protein [Sphaerochaeta globosa]ADY12350.1 Transaldolase [Sphaerochaeta globosa str. Buddy]
MNYLQWLANETDSIWWHDSANQDEQQRALSWGAVGMTTNPFLVNQTLSSQPGQWNDAIKDVLSLYGDEKVLGLVKAVTGHYAQSFSELYLQRLPGYGYVCVQTNPNKCGDYAYMLSQAKQYATWFPNVVIKLPATKAGIQAYEECAALGINVAATVSFTVPQVLSVAQAAKRGIERARQKGLKAPLTIAVLMVGRLDDYLRDVAQDQQADVLESDIRQAGTACIKKAYQLFTQRGYETYLMPAGCRGANHITALSGARMIMSISVKIQEELLSLQGPFETEIDKPVDDAVIRRLLKLSEFRKAYDEDGMQTEDFITFGSCNRTIDQFINDGWNPLVSKKG